MSAHLIHRGSMTNKIRKEWTFREWILLQTEYWVISRPNKHVFISFYSGSFLFDFSSIRAINHNVGTAILSTTNVDCVLLVSTLNTIFILLEKLSQYLATVIIRDVFRTLSNMMELLVKISYGFYLHHSFLTGSWIRLWSWYSIFF